MKLLYVYRYHFNFKLPNCGILPSNFSFYNSLYNPTAIEKFCIPIEFLDFADNLFYDPKQLIAVVVSFIDQTGAPFKAHLFMLCLFPAHRNELV